MKTIKTIAVVAIIAFIFIWAGREIYKHYQGTRGPVLCHLASEGFSLKSGKNMILMDAFYLDSFPEDAAPSPGLIAALKTSEPPYGGANLITVSHIHVDHFDAAQIKTYMDANPETWLLLTPEGGQEFFTNKDSEKYRARVQTAYPEMGRPEIFLINGIEVTVYNLDHRTEVENIGVFVDMGDKTFFHMGDFSSADFEENGLKGLKVDYLLVPYWYLRDEENFQLITDNIEAKYLIPMHLPRADPPADYVERIGSFEDLMASVSGRADNVLMLYDEGACIRPEA